MGSLETRIREDVKTAMRAGAKDELEVLRMVIAEAKNAALAEGADESDLADELVLRTLKKGVKTRNEAAEIFDRHARKDLADRERFQIGMLRRYLPAEAGDAEVEAVVAAVIAELGARDKAAMGRVIKESVARLGGRADGARVSRIAAGKLA